MGTVRTVGYAVFDSPEYCGVEGIVVAVILLCGDIGEGIDRRCRFRLTLRSPQKGDHLCAGAGLAGREMRGVNAVGYAVLICPEDGGVVGVILAVSLLCGNINEGIVLGLGCGRAFRSPQESDYLCSGAVCVGLEDTVAVAGGDTLVYSPLDGLGKGCVAACGSTSVKG